MRILITGGAGFVGSHLCESLCKDKKITATDRITCLDDLSNSQFSNIRNLYGIITQFAFVDGSILDKNFMHDLIVNNDLVIHLAAQIHVDKAVISPVSTSDVNIQGTMNILEECRKYDKSLIYAATSETYGSAKYMPVDEKQPLNPDNIYGATKLSAEKLCDLYERTYGMDIKILKCFNIYGPRQKDTAGGSFIPMTIRRILAGERPIIFGSGEQKRDYTYIDDIVEAYIKTINCKNFGNPINIGYGKSYSINEITSKLLNILKSDLEPRYLAARVLEIEDSCADTHKAKEILGWEPKIDIDTGLSKLCEYYR